MMQNPVQSLRHLRYFPNNITGLTSGFLFIQSCWLLWLAAYLDKPGFLCFALWTYFLSAFLFHLIILQKWLEFKESSSLLKHT